MKSLDIFKKNKKPESKKKCKKCTTIKIKNGIMPNVSRKHKRGTEVKYRRKCSYIHSGTVLCLLRVTLDSKSKNM